MLFELGKGKEFYQEQLALVAAGDVDGLLDNHYHPEAVMTTFDGIRRGREELREYYINRLKALGQVTELRTEYFAETEDTLIFKSILTSETETVHADNAFFFKDGKIYRHLALTILDGFDYDAHGTRWRDG